MMCFFFNFI